MDEDGDGVMDGLNADGRSDLLDARVLSRIADDGIARAGVEPGGLAAYRANAVHGPFVHLDARGVRARW